MGMWLGGVGVIRESEVNETLNPRWGGAFFLGTVRISELVESSLCLCLCLL